MKRLFTTACALLLVLSLLAGCGSAPQAETTEATEAKPEPVYYADYLATFTELTEQGGFTLSELPSVDLEDRLVSYTAIASPDMLPDWNYHIRADRNSSGEVQYARIMTERRNYTDVSFAVLCFYMYTALELPEIDADEFYDTFGLLSDGRISANETIAGWDIIIVSTDEYITFAASCG